MITMNPFLRKQLTHAAHSAEILVDFSASLTILNHINIPIFNFEVRICWTFFPAELPLPNWVPYECPGVCLFFSEECSTR